MPVRRPFYALLLSLFCFMALCAGPAAAQLDAPGGDKAQGAFVSANSRPMLLPVDPAPLIIAGAKSRPAFAVEIARSDDEKARGLMFRRQFPQNRAMLFVFAPEERVITMWMDNTPLPLDMLFADKQGKIVYIYQKAEPFSHRLVSPPQPVSYVVELRAGQVAARNIKVGQKILHPAICGQCG